jgi:hypothetical protein
MLGIMLAIRSGAVAGQVAAAPQSTVPEFRRAIDRAAQAADAIIAAQRRAQETLAAVAAYAEERRIHAAQRCVRPADQPSACAAYDAEAGRLTARRDELRLRRLEDQRQLDLAQAGFSTATLAFATASPLPEREGWRQRVAACAALADKAAAASCLRRERGYDPPVRLVIETAILSPDPQAGMKSRQTLLIDFAERRIGNDFQTGTTNVLGSPRGSVRDNFRVTDVRFVGDRVVLTAVGETASGVRVMPNINYSFELTVQRTGAVRVTGCHDAYPAYSITANGETVYSFRHRPWNLIALFGACDVRIAPPVPDGA